MKKLLFLVSCLCGIINISLSQDTLHFLNKTLQAVKVHEIGIDEIKYHRVDNLDGPLYVANKNDIHYIKFANGHVDSVNVVSKARPKPATEPFTVYKQTTPISTGNEKIVIYGSKLSYNGHPIGEARLMRLIINEPRPEKKSMLLKEYTKMKSYKKCQYLFGFIGLGAAIACADIGIIGSDLDDDTFIFAGFAVGGAIGLTGAITSGIFKHKRTKQKIKVAELYNE